MCNAYMLADKAARGMAARLGESIGMGCSRTAYRCGPVIIKVTGEGRECYNKDEVYKIGAHEQLRRYFPTLYAHSNDYRAIVVECIDGSTPSEEVANAQRVITEVSKHIHISDVTVDHNSGWCPVRKSLVIYDISYPGTLSGANYIITPLE